MSVTSCALLADISDLGTLNDVGTFVQVSNLPQLTSLDGLQQRINWHRSPATVLVARNCRTARWPACAVSST